MGKLFLGKYERNERTFLPVFLHEKGRLQLPAKLVEEAEGKFYLLHGFDGCIAVYPEAGFQRIMDHLSELDWNDERDRAYIRMVTASSYEARIDAHGRILIGKEILLDYVEGSEVTVIGALDHFEIWDARSYARYALANGSQYEAMAARKKS